MLLPLLALEPDHRFRQLQFRKTGNANAPISRQKKKTKKTPKKTKYVMTLSSPQAERLLVLRKKLGVPFKNRLLSTNSKHSVLGKSQKDG